MGDPMTLAPNDFTHLHVHSEFSLLDGLGRGLVDQPTEHPTWVALAVLLGTSAVLAALAARVFRWSGDSR